MRKSLLFSTAVFVSLFAGCQSTYYSAMEKFGIEKRDILVDRVEEARDAQEETKETFASTLEEFSALIEFDGGDLEKLYERLKDRLADSQGAAAEVKERIESIESVATALFREWDSELDQYSSPSLRRQSEDQLKRTQRQYEELIATMRRAESKIPPVLTAFSDQVLFLKHNLNAQAIASLENEALRIQGNVETLIAEMESAIDEANAFIASMK
jgi:hypothetical protein